MKNNIPFNFIIDEYILHTGCTDVHNNGLPLVYTADYYDLRRHRFSCHLHHSLHLPRLRCHHRPLRHHALHAILHHRMFVNRLRYHIRCRDVTN